jgi:hypothetical protein
MSIEENKAITRRFVEEPWNQVNVAVLDELCTPNAFIVPSAVVHSAAAACTLALSCML